MKLKRRLLFWTAALAMGFGIGSGACGDTPAPDDTDPGIPVVVVDFAPVPDPGPRFFPAPQKPFFPDREDIVTLPPEPKDRMDLRLHDQVFWLPDSIASRVVDYSIEQLVFERGEVDDVLLGYRPGHIVLNKYYEIRHQITLVEKTEDLVIWHTSLAEYEEIIREGHLYIDLKPGAAWPLGFDPIDVYLYEDRDSQIEDIVNHYLESPFMVRQMELLLADHPELFHHPIAQQTLAASDNYRTISQGLNACPRHPLVNIPLCSFPHCNSFPDQGVDNELMDCLTDVGENIQHYRALPATNNREGNEECVAAGKAIEHCWTEPQWNAETEEFEMVEVCKDLCACEAGRTDEQCQKTVCEQMCGFEDDEQTNEGGLGAGFSVCVNPDTHPEANDPSSPHHVDKRCPHPLGGVGILRPALELDALPIFKLSFRPILNITVGFKASLKFYFIGARLRLGFYAGLGYGINTELQVGIEEGDAYEREWFLSEILGQDTPLIQIPVFFVVIGIDPAIRLKAYAQATIGGTIGYEYYDEHWFYICFYANVGTSGVNAGVKRGDEARSMCSLPQYDREDSDFNGFYQSGDFRLEVSAGVVAGLGVKINVMIAGVPSGGPEAYVIFYPIEVRANLTISLLAPRCYGSFRFGFGGSLKGGITLFKIMGFKVGWSFNVSWNYPWNWSTRFGLTGGIWESIFGCGIFPEAEPEQRNVQDCPFTPDPDDLDGNCTAELEQEARCFVQECVAMDEVRFSLGWQTQHDLDLFVRTPSGATYSQGSTPDAFSRHSCGGVCGEESSNRFIENMTLSELEDGEYRVWVSMNSSMGDAFEVPFTVEYETLAGDKYTMAGSIPAGEAELPVSFVICAGDPSHCPNVR